MMHALINDGIAVQYPYTDTNLRRDNLRRNNNTTVSFPETLTDEIRAEFGMEPVTVEPRPDTSTDQIATRDTLPTLVNGAWVLGWTVRDKTAEEISADLEASRAETLSTIASSYSAAMAPITDQYPLHEREGWPEQITAAQDVIRGGSSTLIDALASVRSITALEMANVIVAKRDEYQVLYTAMTANFQRLTREVMDAATMSELQAIDVNVGWTI